METNVPTSPQKRLQPMAVLALAALGAVLTAALPLGWLLLPGLIAYVMYRAKPWVAVLPLALLLGFSYVLTGSGQTAALLTGMGLGMALAIWYFQINRMGNAYTALTAAGVGLVFLYLLACLPGLLSGAGAFSQIQAAVDEVVDVMKQVVALTPELPEELSKMYLAYLTEVSAAVPMVAVPILCACAGVLGLVNFLFFRAFACRDPESALQPLRPFCQWSIPRSVALGLFVLLVGTLVLSWSQWTYAEAFSATVNVLVAMPLMLQGLSTIDFLLKRKEKNLTSRRVLVYTLVGVFFWIAQMPLMLVGCFEQLFRVRARQLPPAV